MIKLFNFAPILLETTPKCVSEDSKQMKKSFAEKKNLTNFLLKIICNVCNLKKIKIGVKFFFVRGLLLGLPIPGSWGLRHHAPDAFTLNPPSYPVIGYHWLASMNEVCRESRKHCRLSRQHSLSSTFTRNVEYETDHVSKTKKTQNCQN